ncbi:hypothetical protein G3N57_30485, partial [Paraburkholderia sp. Se-20369]|nr:hypothetical protein [Paraburkholderia sp. Se-20369]
NGLGPVPQFNYGQLMERVAAREAQVRDARDEQRVRDAYRRRAAS